MKKSISLGSGWGGTAHTNGKGERQLFQSVGAIDIWELARRYHLLNWPDTPVYDFDLSKVSVHAIKEAFGEVDLIINTCPCTAMSRANKNATPFHPLNAMLLRTIQMLPILAPGGSMLLENVPAIKDNGIMEIMHALINYEVSKLKDFVSVEGVLNSLYYNTPQSRRRFIKIIIHKDHLTGGKELTLPPFTTTDFDKLRIKNIAPEIRWLKTGYMDEWGRYDKLTPRTRDNWCFTATATPNLFDQDDNLLSIRRLLDFCGYGSDWIYDHDPKAHTSMWNLCGNSVMPPFAKALGEHIYKLMS